MKPLNTIGLTIFSLGALVLIGYGLYELVAALWQDTDIPIIIKLGIVGVILGVLILLIALVSERIKDNKKENL